MGCIQDNFCSGWHKSHTPSRHHRLLIVMQTNRSSIFTQILVFAWPNKQLNPAHALRLLPLQVWLQEFAWIEADKPIKLAARSSMVPKDAELGRQPMFCFETMMNLLYWSCFVYDHMRVRTNFCLSQHCMNEACSVEYRLMIV